MKTLFRRLTVTLATAAATGTLLAAPLHTSLAKAPVATKKVSRMAKRPSGTRTHSRRHSRLRSRTRKGTARRHVSSARMPSRR